MTKDEKIAFRRTKKWLEFRAQEIKKRGLKCELLGTKLSKKTAHLHHLKPQFYDRLISRDFKLLSPVAHDFVEFVALLVHGNKTEVPYSKELMEWIGPFLPEPERSVKKYYDMIKEDVAKRKELL